MRSRVLATVPSSGVVVVAQLRRGGDIVVNVDRALLITGTFDGAAIHVHFSRRRHALRLSDGLPTDGTLRFGLESLLCAIIVKKMATRCQCDAWPLTEHNKAYWAVFVRISACRRRRERVRWHPGAEGSRCSVQQREMQMLSASQRQLLRANFLKSNVEQPVQNLLQRPLDE